MPSSMRYEMAVYPANDSGSLNCTFVSLSGPSSNSHHVVGALESIFLDHGEYPLSLGFVEAFHSSNPDSLGLVQRCHIPVEELRSTQMGVSA